MNHAAPGWRQKHDYYELALIHSMAAKAAMHDIKLTSQTQMQLSGKYAGSAVTWLRTAQEKGYFKHTRRSLLLKNEKEFAPLQTREDFRKFLAELEVTQKHSQ